MPYRRDPVSEYFDGHARIALATAARREGRWVTVRVPVLKRRASEGFFRQGIDTFGGDGNGGGVNRTVRGFVRALYHQHGPRQPLRLVWEPGEETLAGWSIRIKLAPPGDPALPPAAAPFVEPVGSGTTADPFNRDWA